MVRLAQVTDFLQELAPLDLAQSWDSNGLICGDPDEEVKRILLAVDPVEVVVDEAIEKGAQLVITHHPTVFVVALTRWPPVTLKAAWFIASFAPGLGFITATLISTPPLVG